MRFPSRTCYPAVILLYLSIPLMVIAAAIAVLPVLIGSFRHKRSLEHGGLETADSVSRESDFWHHMLGHHRVDYHGATPDLVEDGEVLRVVRADRLVGTNPTVWGVSQPVG